MCSCALLPCAAVSCSPAECLWPLTRPSDQRHLYDRLGRQAYEAKRKGGRQADRYGGGFRTDHHFFHQESGLYDDDPQIETLSDGAFFELDASDKHVMVKFYSPGCSHCDDLAPAWRDIGSRLMGIVTVAAVNCHHNWGLCHRLGIRGYPTVLRLGAGDARVEFRNHATLEALFDFALEPFGKPRALTDVTELAAVRGPKLLLVGGMGGSPLAATDMPIRQLAAALHGVLSVWELDCLARATLCASKGWEDNHARFVDNESKPFGMRFYPSDPHEEWDDSFRVQSLVDAAIGLLPFPESVSLVDLRAATLAHDHDALAPHVVGEGGLVSWHSISAAEACESNDEGIVRVGWFEKADSVEHCQALCAERTGCTAIDFFSATRWW